MPRPLYKSPEHLVSSWPEVFEDLYISTFPIDYVDLIKLNFVNGRCWEIDLHLLPDYDFESIENMIFESCRDTEDEILKLEFRLNIPKLKNDIKIQSKNLF